MKRNEIVVGLDDSAPARAALRWAAEQARLTGSVLRAIHVLDWPTGAGADGVPYVEDWVYGQDETHDKALRAMITQLFDEIDPEPDWSVDFARGKPGAILVREAAPSKLLVVGTGEHVGLGRVLIGSTSHYCLSHASTPVVAVSATYSTSSALPPVHAASAAGEAGS